MSNLKNSYPKEVDDIIIEKVEDGWSNKEIFDYLTLNNLFHSSYNAFGKYIWKIKKKKGIIRKHIRLKEVEEKIIALCNGKKIIKVPDLLRKLDCSKTELNKSILNCRRNGYEIEIDNNIVIFSKTTGREPENISKLSQYSELIFGIVSDPHFGSKSCQITAVNEFAEIMKQKGVHHIFCPGDLVCGYDVYPGQIHDIYATSATEQEETTLLNLPTGFDWYVLGGNHDYSFIKRGGGYNIVSVIASKRADVHYLGFDQATVPILQNVDLMMVHPSGGVPYSISYRLQKNIEQITIGELQNVVRGVKDKPSIRFVLLGHLHIQMQAMFGSIWGAQCGCFEGQTNYLKRKGLIPSIGGWIVKVSLGKNGLLKNFESKFYIFDEIQDDWKNYKHTIPEKKITTPIFE